MIPIPIAIHDQAIPVLLPQTATETARAFAAHQDDPDQAQRVYRNILAVYAVHTYLTILGIDSDLAQGDSWHPIIRSTSDTADLFVAGRGRLECRPVWPEDTALAIPAEAQRGRIAYVAVALTDRPTEAHLLGFVVPAPALDNQLLQSMDNFIDYLWTVHHTDLRLWLEQRFDDTWQEPKAVLLKAPVVFRLRGEVTPPIRRAKRIELRSHPHPLALGLLISLRAQDTSIQVSAQLYGVSPDSPAGEAQPDTTLPPGIALTLLSDTAESLQSVTARAEFPDTFIQLLPFTCEPGDQYSIQISFRDQTHTEVLIA